MAQNVTIAGASYTDVPSIDVPKTGGGTAAFIDVTDTTAIASDVAQGKYFYTSTGVKTEGTSSGGGGEDKLVEIFPNGIVTTNRIGVNITDSTGTSTTGNIIGYEYSAGYEGMNIKLENLESGKDYKVHFSFQLTSGAYHPSGFFFGYRISNTEYTDSRYP